MHTDREIQDLIEGTNVNPLGKQDYSLSNSAVAAIISTLNAAISRSEKEMQTRNMSEEEYAMFMNYQRRTEDALIQIVAQIDTASQKG